MAPEDLKLQDFFGTDYFNGKNTTCIDLTLTNQKQLFMKYRTFITSISNFHALTASIMKLNYATCNPKIKLYRDYKHFDIDLFQVSCTDKK